jgi:hypothetical protein
MIQFLCDWCSGVKQPEETWILGHAAEAVGVTSARREVTLLSGWDWQRAVHPLAVHFCSLECKEKYMAELFGPEVKTEEAVVERTVPAGVVVERRGPAEVVVEPPGPAEIVVERTSPYRKTIVTKKVKSRRKRAA